jgi:hypothetical protein
MGFIHCCNLSLGGYCVGKLKEALELFNRKERNLLIRDMFETADKPLHFNSDFRNRLSEKLGFVIQEDAWCTTDYHINWLAGALLIYMNDFPPEGILLCEQSEPVKWGNPEDFDLVVAAGDHLILVEAKAYGYFGTEQYERKLDRLKRIYVFYKSLEKHSDRRVLFHFLLCSPSIPTGLSFVPLPWPCNPPQNCVKDQWMKLECPEPSKRLTVTRCDKDGNWKVHSFRRVPGASHLTS